MNLEALVHALVITASSWTLDSVSTTLSIQPADFVYSHSTGNAEILVTKGEHVFDDKITFKEISIIYVPSTNRVLSVFFHLTEESRQNFPREWILKHYSFRRATSIDPVHDTSIFSYTIPYPEYGADVTPAIQNDHLMGFVINPLEEQEPVPAPEEKSALPRPFSLSFVERVRLALGMGL
jgi:hypothetical protein